MMLKKVVLPVFALLCQCVSLASVAESTDSTVKGSTQSRGQVLELQSTIVGNQEQPEVIYIIPWKQIEAPAPHYQPMKQLVDSQFDLLDRDEWRRKIGLERAVNDQQKKSH